MTTFIICATIIVVTKIICHAIIETHINEDYLTESFYEIRQKYEEIRKLIQSINSEIYELTKRKDR